MSAQHTPWKIGVPFPGDKGCEIIDAKQNRVCREITVEHARRIVACVNACAGIDTAFLIAWAHGVQQNDGKPWADRIDVSLSEIHAIRRQCDDLSREVVTLTVELGEVKQQRDELLAKCDDLEKRDLDRKAIIDDALVDRCNQLQDKCDELLNALIESVCALEVCGKDFRATEIGRQAIAKVKGQQS